MDFRLLGPLEVRSEGRPLALGGPKQRAVLAMLLLQAGEVVSNDKLIDELWGERPPKTVDAYIQNCIHRLRAVLGRELIETRRPGYALHVDGADIDAVRFERALEAARQLEPPERAAALREALGLWRGSPFADLAFETFAQGEIARLEELRLTALEVRLEAELELGRHAEVLPELTALANRYPAREQLRYLQMLSLYRSGRQREALRAYQEARRELVEELGLEPGEQLRSLERMIIAHDPTLGVETADALVHDLRRVAVLAVELAEGIALEGFDQLVDDHGGTVRELLAEEAIAVFAGHDDDVMRALRAGFALRGAVAGVRTVVDRLGAGEVDAVRSLLRSVDAESVVITADALALVPAAVDVVPHESGAFRILRFDSHAEPFARRYDTPLVGRRDELGRLRAELDDVVSTGSARRFVLVGEAGVGKTRLVREFVQDSRRRAHIVVGRCVAYGEGTALLPLLEILRRVGRLETALAGEADAERVAARLRDPSAFERSEGFWAFRRLLESLSRRLPLIVVLEDMHWGAGTFLDLVDYLDGWTAAPVMLLCLGRLELLDRRPEWRDNALVLEPMEAADARQLATRLAELDAEALERAVEAAEGNPLFLEQLIASGTELAPGQVPPTLQALIATRLDALPRAERAALERAAVAGRAFWRAAVEDATPRDERDEVGAALISLVRRGLVHPERSELEGEDGFRFHHALIRDVAYAGVPATTRAAVHEAVARSLDGRHPALDELVGHHLEQASRLRDDPELAREAGLRLGVAGMRALKRVDGAAAADLLTRATALLRDDRSRLELEWGLGTAIKFSGDWVEANSRLAAVAEQAAANGDRVNELRARIEQLWPKLARGGLAPEAALGFLEEARRELEAAGDELGLGRAWHATAAILGSFELRWTEEEAAALAAVRCYSAAGFAAGALGTLLAVPLMFGPTVVNDAIERCRQLLARTEAPVWASFVQPPLAVLEAMNGEFDEARGHLEEARRGREEFSDSGTIVTSWSAEAAMVELLAGEPARADGILADSVAVLESAGDASWLATNSALLAEAQYRQGRFEAALRSSERALSVSPRGYLSALVVAARPHAKALARVGRVDEARSLALETRARLAATDAVDEQGEAAVAAAEVFALAGDPEGAHELTLEAITLFEQKGNVVSAARVRADEESWGKPS